MNPHFGTVSAAKAISTIANSAATLGASSVSGYLPPIPVIGSLHQRRQPRRGATLRSTAAHLGEGLVDVRHRRSGEAAKAQRRLG
jgi:hypothetical protein